MGTSISIDKHVSSLDDILEMSPAYFDKIKFESKISPDITQHLKVLNLSKNSLFIDLEVCWRQAKIWKCQKLSSAA